MPADRDPPRMTDAEAAVRRKGAVRTASIVAAIAVMVYVAFILAGVLGQ